MTFYEIKLNSIPKIIFCSDVTIENYKNSFHHRENFLEISLNLQGDTYRVLPDKTKQPCPEHQIATITTLSDFDIYSQNSETQRHITVGITADYSCVKRDTENCTDLERIKKDILEKGLILLPDAIELQDFSDKTESILRDIMWAHISGNPRHVLYALSYWYKLTALLTEFVLLKIEKAVFPLSPGALLYVEKAKRFISKHYNKKITAEDIAKELDISQGYLFDIFKKATGLTLIRYINIHKVNIFIGYIKDYRLNLNEAAAQVGIDDPAYMSRLFKKVTGTNFRNYFENDSV